jgi:nicotinate-nucleotide adenylyltransferase
MTVQERALHLCFGGTFDPVHNGHLRVLFETSQVLKTELVRILPCHIPPHKEAPETSPEQRLAMLRLALESQPNWMIDQRELARDKPSYTIDTLLELRQDLGPQAALAWLVGMDSFASLHKWHRWNELGDHAHIIVVGRPGSRLPTSGPVAEWAQSRQTTVERLRDTAAGAVLHLSTTQQEIASSSLRAGVRAGLAPRYLVPDAVNTYIVKHKLYS